jgi:hypothetical protein
VSLFEHVAQKKVSEARRATIQSFAWRGRAGADSP